jgi:hypothetical protein
LPTRAAFCPIALTVSKGQPQLNQLQHIHITSQRLWVGRGDRGRKSERERREG